MIIILIFFYFQAVEENWCNLAEQESQICVPYCINFEEQTESHTTRCVRPFLKDAYRGGSCLLINRPSDVMVNVNYYIRLI